MYIDGFFTPTGAKMRQEAGQQTTQVKKSRGVITNVRFLR